MYRALPGIITLAVLVLPAVSAQTSDWDVIHTNDFICTDETLIGIHGLSDNSFLMIRDDGALFQVMDPNGAIEDISGGGDCVDSNLGSSALSADRTTLVIKEGSNMVRVSTVPDLQLVGLHTYDNESVRSVALSSDAALLAIGMESGRIVVQELPSWDVIADWQAHSTVAKMLFSPDDTYLVSRDNQFMTWWEVNNGWVRHQEWSSSPNSFGPIAYSPDGTRFVRAIGSGEMDIYDTSDWTSQGSLILDDLYLTRIQFSPDGNRLVVAINGEEVSVRFYDRQLGPAGFVTISDQGFREGPRPLAFSSTGDRIAVSYTYKVHVLGLAQPSQPVEGSSIPFLSVPLLAGILLLTTVAVSLRRQRADRQ